LNVHLTVCIEIPFVMEEKMREILPVKKHVPPAGRRLRHMFGTNFELAYPPNTPAWRIVHFPPYGCAFVYDTLEHATNARIIARAWFNREAELKGKIGWAEFARTIGYVNKKPREEKRTYMSAAVSNRLYGCVC